MADLTHRDEIHGDIRYDPLAAALLNTPPLQRLGRVYQLGYGHLVYRGGTHTRLSHAMGTYHTAARLVRALRRNYEGAGTQPRGALHPPEFLPRGLGTDGNAEGPNELTDRWRVLLHLVCWAALLHDVGHVPLGHTLEDEFDGIYQKHDDFASPRLRHLWLHADSEISAGLRRTDLYPAAFDRLGITDGDAVVAAVLLICLWKERVADGYRTTFQEVLEGHLATSAGEERGIAPDLLDSINWVSPGLFAPYMADIVANTISADYLDYLRRDPQNLGLDVLRDDRVVSCFWVGADHRGQARMALSLVDRRGKPRLDTCTGVVELVRQRYRFAEIVYYHKTKVAASAMLAKIFHLVGAPDEIPAVRTLPTISSAEQRVEELLEASDKRRRTLVHEVRADCQPTALLDPEVGDESLTFLLRARAAEQLDEALRHRDRQGAADALRSVALLDALARRELYKTAFTMGAGLFPSLSGRQELPHGDIERELLELIGRLRGNAEQRASIEADMVAAADWPACSILLYVPGRKSQAKGIETGALADGTVVTLGAHPAVEAQVKELGVRYADLWRLIILVHPERANDVVGLSAAVDAFVGREFPHTSLHDHGVIHALNQCCWFPYQARPDRDAARHYAVLIGRDGPSISEWQHVGQYAEAVERCTGEELAFGAALLTRASRRISNQTALLEITRLGSPSNVRARVADLQDADLASASRLGEEDVDASVRAAQDALEILADEVCRNAASR